MVSSLIRPRPSRQRECEDAFCFGIEEEYFLCCAESLEPARETPESLFSSADACLGREMLQAQLEVATEPHRDAQGARRELSSLRATAHHAASKRGLKILACGTHPSAKWRES